MENLPLLPGNRFSDVTRTNFIVPRTLSFKNGHRIIRVPRFGIGQTYKPDTCLTEEERQLLDNFQPELIYGKVRVQEPRKFIPANLFYDKKILRFYGYFKQIIHESPLESYRIRQVIIYYYLEDDTIAIYEIPYKNSALNQGMRIRRHRISKNNQNEPYNWRDLNLRQNLIIYGTIYRICDCDQFTREWLESEGIELQCSESIPSDPYMLKLMEKNLNKLKDILIEEKVIDKKMDGKILRFYAMFNSQDHFRKFIIHVYLIDNTIEIREIHRNNNGYDPLPIYLHRQLVPKDSTYNIKSFVNLFLDQREQNKINYLKANDFILGEHITIFNRVFFLYDCDKFTRDFCQFDINRLPSISPHNEDKTKNVGRKSKENEQRVLRYEAILESSNENDCCRRFLIVYRLADEFISVYEKPINGYGCLTRKFLERVRIPKPDSHPDAPIYYQPNDFYIGAHVEFYKHRFKIINADRFVLKFIEENQEQFSQHVIDSFRKHVCSTESKKSD
ncbi:unnamed protein product [Adineta steineri]|uniref:DM10 domain-containing protein n=1 Tax=Adineta steineri TaxID=433720 RepID=A0A818P733_9BILA|nr:unnamed protein product [Adineta steineri]CAF3616698.1 unnamed protein product [Adineta steineri]